MRKALKMVMCGALLLAALFSLSAFTSAFSAHAATRAGVTGQRIADTTVLSTTACPPTV